jgi:outer membrane protein insertion porin family
MKARLICFFLITCVLCGLTGHALGQGKDIVIKVDVTGNDRIERGVVTNAIKTKEKEVYDPDKIREDMKNVYKTGFFSDVQVDVKETPEGKVVTFVVVERPPVSEISLQGNKKIKTEDLKDKIKLKVGSVLNTEKIKETVDELKKHYASKNYYGAKVTYNIDYEEGYRAKVTFLIDESQKAYVRKITFTGNKHLKAGTLTDYMKTREKGILSWFTGSGTMDDEQLDEDRRNLVAFYADNGYVRATVGLPETTLSKDGKQIFITLPITEGNVYKIGSVELAGDSVVPEEQLRKLLKSKSGNTFKSSLLQQDVTSITDTSQDKGYAFADVNPLTSVDDDTSTINLTFETSKGPQVFINRINITGNLKTRDKVIRRELRLAEGDLFSAARLKESKRRLRNTTYFKESDLKLVKTDEPDKVNLDAVVEERPTGTISMGIGYSTYENVILTGSVSQENILGTGLKAYLMAAVSSINQMYDFSVVKPYIFDLDVTAALNLFNWTRVFDTYEYRSKGGAISLLRPITDNTRVGLKYGYNVTDVFNVTPDASAYVQSQAGTASTSSVTASIYYNTLNDLLNPTSGWIAETNLEVAGGPFGGDNQFIKPIARAGKYFPYRWDTAFFVRGTAGYVWPYGGTAVPIYQNFFVGGLSSVRGFRYGEAGPKDNTGEIVGGQGELYFNFEYIFPIYKPAGLRGVVFFDVGHGFNGSDWVTDIKTAAGFGIRWLSPMGPIRIELGFNLNPKEGEKRNVFDFMMGRAY